MRILTQQTLLSRALTQIAYALENKDELEAYTHVSVRAKGRCLELGATNRHMHVESSIGLDHPIKERAEFGLAGNLLKKIATYLPEGPVEIAVGEDNVKINSVSSMFTLPTLSSDMFLKSPDYSRMRFSEVGMGDLLRSLKKVYHCVPQNSHRPEFVSVLINNDHFVACDGWRMAIYPNNVFRLEEEVMVHADQVPRMLRVYGSLVDKRGGIALEGGADIHFACEGVYCSTRLKSGKYPDYKSILPRGGGTPMVFSKESLKKATERAILVHEKELPVVKLEVFSGRCLVSSKSSYGKSSDHIESGSDQDVSCYVNGKYLLDAINQIEGDQISAQAFRGNNGVNKLVIKEGDYVNVILPIKRD